MYVEWSTIAKLRREPTFLAVIQFKIDPLVNLIAGGRVTNAIFQVLPDYIRQRFKEFREHVAHYRTSQPHLNTKADLGSYVESWLKESEDDSNRIQLLPLAGLDCAEVLVVAQSSSLNTIVRTMWAIRSLRLRHLGLTGLEVASVRDLVGDVTLEALHRLPVWTYSSTIVGVPCDAVDERVKPQDPQAWACEQALFAFQMRALPGSAQATESELKRLNEILGKRSNVPARFTIFGSYDLLHIGGAVVEESPESPKSSMPGPRPYKMDQILEILAPPSGAAAKAPIGVCGFVLDTTVAIRAFPPGLPRPDLVGEIETNDGKSVQERFEDALATAQEKWLGKSYNDFVAACRDRCWPYPTTNGAVNLIVSLLSLLINRLELENYIELVEALEQWMFYVSYRKDSPREQLERVYKHLDRMMHARSHRDAPHHAPGVSRAFEARAGYVLPRDAFHAYLRDIFQSRLDTVLHQRHHAMLLVDGADGKFVVKHAHGCTIFYVSALRLHNPILWLSCAHEVEHARYRNEELTMLQREALERLASRKFGDRCRSLRSALREIDPFDPLDPLGEHGIAVEVGCDLALIDSGAMAGSRVTPAMCLLAVTLPNLISDHHADWVSHKQQRMARRIGVRLAGMLALVNLEPVEYDCGIIRRRILKIVKDSTLWEPALKEVLTLCGSRRGRESPSKPQKPKKFDETIQVVRNWIIQNVDGYATMLTAIQLLRRRTEPRRSVSVLAEYVTKFLARTKSESPSDICAAIFPRGGLDPGSADAEVANEIAYELYDKLRESVQEQRLNAARLLLRGPRQSDGGVD